MKLNKPVVATLCFLLKEDKILLALKKRGFGIGNLNGIGGKVEPGETIEQATIRETQEEIGVKLLKLDKVAILDFHFPENNNFYLQVHTYTSKSWQGEPEETEEMKPEWFLVKNIPYDKMWSDDSFWLPLVLAGKKIKGTFEFDRENKVQSHKVTIEKSLHEPT